MSAPRRVRSSNLAIATRVANEMLARYGDSTGYDVFAYTEAHGGLREALRILLRALGEDEKGSSPARTLGGDRQRCPAAHPDDPTPCSGTPVVTILDTLNTGATGCEHHAARLLASLTGGRVYPLPDAPDGAAIRVFKTAGSLRLHAWLERGEAR